MRYILELIAAFAILIVPFFLTKLDIWGFLFIAVAIILASFEVFACLTGKAKSLSRRFWELKEESPKKAWGLVSAMLVFWIFLICHLMLKW